MNKNIKQSAHLQNNSKSKLDYKESFKKDTMISSSANKAENDKHKLTPIKKKQIGMNELSGTKSQQNEISRNLIPEERV